MELEREQEKHSQTRTKELERQQTGAASAFFCCHYRALICCSEKIIRLILEQGQVFKRLLEQDYYKVF